MAKNNKKSQDRLAKISSGFSGRKLALQKRLQSKKAKEQRDKREREYLNSLD